MRPPLSPRGRRAAAAPVLAAVLAAAAGQGGRGMRGVNAVEVVRADIRAVTAQDGGTGRLVDPRPCSGSRRVHRLWTAPVMWAAGPAYARALPVRLPYESTRHRLRDVDTAILASSALAAAAVALAGLFLAHRISRRLTTTAAAARRISTGDLEIDLGFANAPDGGAVTTLRLPVGRLTEGVPRERFT
ncbi:histidine kinase HAMP region domain protein [Actinobacteria bacterium OV450]|nr:histidine kinase HAMP region domain protein [Actinobacteria bacterium OV450]